MVAARLDMAIAVFSVALVFALGGLSGTAAGFFGGWTDRIVLGASPTPSWPFRYSCWQWESWPHSATP